MNLIYIVMIFCLGGFVGGLIMYSVFAEEMNEKLELENEELKEQLKTLTDKEL